MSRKKIKVLFVIPSLRAGGAERVMSYVSQNLNPNLFDTTLLVIGHRKDTSYTLDRTNVVFLKKNRVLFSFLPIFFFLKKHQPHIVISAIGHVNALMGLESIFFRRIIFVGREVNVISVLSKIQPSKKWYAFLNLTKHTYKLLDIILCQSRDMADDMRINFDVPLEKIRIVNNPISDEFYPKEEYPINLVPKFVTVGSLVERKGHKRILNALLNYDGAYEYMIIGNGSMADEILDYAAEKGMKENITHIPFTKNVADYLKKADVFLQGSFVEGFPNALLESCATGTPVIAFKAKGGINEIVENGINGYIVENEMEFTDKLSLLLSKKLNPKQVSFTVFQKFSSSKILKQYETLFLEALQQ
ncbi:glycosyltransferase [Croceitalea rosinachiae]|uniref:Glycosyltransferase n=1 Tax=Croceitalea rosinachiae TaxID=3075596 RepID=A0ABU3ACC2_9FLAO|nr:glycosyltransferase [Croceitalea sp. F388]MDT0607836.1 glycosyltransferase [Croceitalea sp. F388]